MRVKAISVILSSIMLICFPSINIFAAENVLMSKSENEFGSSVNDSIPYSEYYNKYKDKDTPNERIEIQAAENFNTGDSFKYQIVADTEGAVSTDGQYLICGDEGFVEWKFEVENEGLYNLFIEYFPFREINDFKGKSSYIERSIMIDGKLPFAESEVVLLERIWRDDLKETGLFEEDRYNNQIKPTQVEVQKWNTVAVKDMVGYAKDPLKYYLTKGVHTVRLVSIREPVLLSKLVFGQAESVSPYKPLQPDITNEQIIIQGEAASLKSEQVLFARSDRSSSLVQPYDLMSTKLNYIGGTSWSKNGQWIEWSFDVDKPGYYAMDIKYRQDEKRGMISARKIYIDGKVPYSELESVEFPFDSDWKIKRLSNQNDEVILFYLDAGPHTVRIENTLGEIRDIANHIEKSTQVLNDIYRKILMVVGNSPDEFRDYQIGKQFPTLKETLSQQVEILSEQLNALEKKTGEKSSQTAIIQKVIFQLRRLIKDPEQISKKNNFDTLKTNIGALSAWVLDVTEQPLDIDYIKFVTPDIKQDKTDPGLLNKLWTIISQIAVTYIKDYNLLGSEAEENTITVWAGSGRDQATIIKSMIDEEFTINSGINVNLKLIDPNAVLMQAVISGRAPDVALGIPKATPVNYALRGAVEDLSKYNGFDEVRLRFRKSALTPFEFNGGTYALPETETFFMMFFRTDILEELNIKVPQTWDDVYEIIPMLQRYNLEFALPDPNATAGDIAFAPFLLQAGGKFYNTGGKTSALDSEQSLNAFKMWTDFYLLSKLPVSYDTPSRFRRGEIPIVISDYTLYNTLSVSAPEIRGRWDMAPIPGTLKADGTITRATSSNSSGCIMLKQADNKQQAWDFMKWWTSEKTQTRFGREMESLLGSSARYPTANLQAMDNIAWTTKTLKSLKEQGKYVQGIPEVPGGYFTPRHIENAFRYVTNNNENSRDTLLDYIKYINEEISQKRKEFKLDR